jgi:hypothetical protein
VVRRFLTALPKHFHQIAMVIETLLELGLVPVEELVGRLKAAEERYGLTGGGSGAQLNLTEDKLGTLRTDRGGEFTAQAFMEYYAGQGV